MDESRFAGSTRKIRLTGVSSNLVVARVRFNSESRRKCTSASISVNPTISQILISREYWSLVRHSQNVLKTPCHAAVYRADDESTFGTVCFLQFLPHGPSNAPKMLS